MTRWLASMDVVGVDTDSVVLVCSELVTNVVLHGAGPVRLSIALRSDGVLVQVGDSTPGRARLRAQGPGPQSTSGRGLVIVEALSSQWGVLSEARSKTVWALVARST